MNTNKSVRRCSVLYVVLYKKVSIIAVIVQRFHVNSAVFVCVSEYGLAIERVVGLCGTLYV